MFQQQQDNSNLNQLVFSFGRSEAAPVHSDLLQDILEPIALRVPEMDQEVITTFIKSTEPKSADDVFIATADKVVEQCKSDLVFLRVLEECASAIDSRRSGHRQDHMIRFVGELLCSHVAAGNSLSDSYKEIVMGLFLGSNCFGGGDLPIYEPWIAYFLDQYEHAPKTLIDKVGSALSARVEHAQGTVQHFVTLLESIDLPEAKKVLLSTDVIERNKPPLITLLDQCGEWSFEKSSEVLELSEYLRGVDLDRKPGSRLQDAFSVLSDQDHPYLKPFGKRAALIRSVANHIADHPDVLPCLVEQLKFFHLHEGLYRFVTNKLSEVRFFSEEHHQDAVDFFAQKLFYGPEGYAVISKWMDLFDSFPSATIVNRLDYWRKHYESEGRMGRASHITDALDRLNTQFQLKPLSFRDRVESSLVSGAVIGGVSTLGVGACCWLGILPASVLAIGPAIGIGAGLRTFFMSRSLAQKILKDSLSSSNLDSV